MYKDNFVFVVTHKQADIPSCKGYLPIVVGKNENGTYPIFTRDNTGDNIAEKNSNYCELTALYWMWKNTHSPIIGLCHYRRYFVDSYISEIKKRPINMQKIVSILNKYDIIVPVKNRFSESVENQLVRTSVKKEDLAELKRIISEKYNDYLDTYDNVMHGREISCYNMMICKKNHFDAYCKWLFDILFELEKVTNLEGRTDYEKRIYGFLSERLLNVWIIKNQLKVKYLHVLETEADTNPLQLLKKRVKTIL